MIRVGRTWTFYQIPKGLAFQRCRSVRVPAMQVMTAPPVQISGPFRSTCTRPMRLAAQRARCEHVDLLKCEIGHATGPLADR
jgi:hypothetical protein